MNEGNFQVSLQESISNDPNQILCHEWVGGAFQQKLYNADKELQG